MVMPAHIRTLNPASMLRVSPSRIEAELCGRVFGSTFAADAEEYFEANGFGLFRETAHGDTQYLGVTSERVHDHDRWLYVLDTYQYTESLLFVVRGEQPDESADPYDYVPEHLTRLTTESAILKSCARAITAARPDAEVSIGELLVLQRLLPNMTNIRAANMPGLLDRLSELHDLLHHREIWDSENPAFQGMPTAIVLRMLGAGDDQ